VILFVGITDNKNLIRTAEALGGIPCRLHIVGKLSPRKRGPDSSWHPVYVLFGAFRRRNGGTICRRRPVLFPSTFEGFGLPIVEGQKAGRPVITSDLSPMRETAGAGACLVDPYDSTSIRQGVLRIMGSLHTVSSWFAKVF